MVKRTRRFGVAARAACVLAGVVGLLGQAPARAAGCVSGSVVGPVLHIHDSSGRLASVNIGEDGANSSVTIIGQMGSVMTDIAFDSNGRLFAIDFTTLYEVNPFDGSTTSIGPHGVGGANALVFSPDGSLLYLAASSDRSLYLVDPRTGASSPVADVGYFSAGDLAFVEGQLYLTATTGDLIALNPSGSAPIGTRVGATGFSNVFGLATANTGTLYGIAGTTVFSIDTATGNGTAVLNYSASALGSANGSSFFDESGNDQDCDGLWDDWETNGLTTDDGVVIDFPAMGADPQRADVFIQLDRMQGVPAPRKSALDAVIAAFDNSPYQPPNCAECLAGVSLHIDAGPGYTMDVGTGATWGSMSEANVTAAADRLGILEQSDDDETYYWSCGTEALCFDDIKTPVNFSPARRQALFHYGLYAQRLAGANYSGISRGIPARDFIVARAGLDEVEERGTLMHELGHNLGLRHGGGDNDNYKPNYLSVMNYIFQLDGLETPGGSGGLDYSRAALSTLIESALNEDLPLVGINSTYEGYGSKYWCEGLFDDLPRIRIGAQEAVVSEPVDWNCNGDIDAATVATDINRSDSDLPDEQRRTALVGHDDWAALTFAGGQVAALAAGQPLPQAIDATMVDEIDVDVLRQIPTRDGVRLAQPDTVLRSSDGSISITLANEGTRDAAYAIAVTSLDGEFDPTVATTPVSIAAGGTGQVVINIGSPGAQERAGQLELSARDVSNPLIVDSVRLDAVLEAAPPPPPPPAPPPSGGSGGGGGVGPLMLLGLLLWRTCLRRGRRRNGHAQ